MKLLLVEDEKSLSRAVQIILEKNHYTVEAVFDGEEALSYLELDHYDGVILDIMIPKIDGITILKTVRAKGNNVPVILLTAKSEIDDKVLGLDSGANDYLTKPFDMKELLARLRAMTRVQTSHTNSQLQFGNITLDSVNFELCSPSGNFRLANKEFMERIWGYDSDTDIRVVWVYISYLRKKLEALDANIQIKVARNIGYSLEEIL